VIAADSASTQHLSGNRPALGPRIGRCGAVLNHGRCRVRESTIPLIDLFPDFLVLYHRGWAVRPLQLRSTHDPRKSSVSSAGVRAQLIRARTRRSHRQPVCSTRRSNNRAQPPIAPQASLCFRIRCEGRVIKWSDFPCKSIASLAVSRAPRSPGSPKPASAADTSPRTFRMLPSRIQHSPSRFNMVPALFTNGEVALITGAARASAKAMARGLAASGALSSAQAGMITTQDPPCRISQGDRSQRRLFRLRVSDLDDTKKLSAVDVSKKWASGLSLINMAERTGAAKRWTDHRQR